MEEEWVHWNPIEDLEVNFSLESILDTIDGFEVLLTPLHGEKRRLKIRFEASVASFKTTYRPFRNQLILELREKYGESFCSMSLFKVNNSKYIQWLSEDSYTISDYWMLLHYAIFTDNWIIDIVDRSNPIVEWLENPAK